MAYQVLARKYRPQRFSDVYGQEHVTRTLLNALEQKRTAHGYIFSGHRGIGKTSIARILAMALNCRAEIGSSQRPSPEPCGACTSCQEIRAGNSIDMMEIDAATNRGIDEIRELRDAARYSPARDRYKIYLLDEAHQITDAAFNALLKTLEEPPDHVVFMMATTQPEDIPQTIRSRCQHFSFHAVKFDDILAQLRQIAELEGVRAEDAALSLLAEAGDGSVRDALSIMDQAIASAPIEEGKPRLEATRIQELIGTVPNTVFAHLLQYVHENQTAAVMEEANRLLDAGSSPSQLARQMVRYLRNCLMAKLGGESTELLQISADERARAASSAALFSEEDLARFLAVMLRTFDELNYRQEQRFHLELGLLKLVHLERLIPLEEILASLPSIPSASRAAPEAGVRTAAAATGANPSLSEQLQSRTAPAAVSGGAAPRPALPPPSVRKAAPVPGPVPGKVPEPLEASPPESANSAPQSRNSPPQPIRESEPAACSAAKPIDCEQARDTVVAALDANGHSTAASLLQAGHWTIDADGALQAVLGVKKTMLGLAMSAEAWRIVRDALCGIGITHQIRVIPGEVAAVAPAMAPRAGTVEQVALENPLVLQTMELFRAEVRSVVDLRESSQGDSRNK